MVLRDSSEFVLFFVVLIKWSSVVRRCFTAFYADSKAILRFCTAHFLLRCEETSEDLYKSIDLSVDVLERQITKNKKRIAAKILNENIKDIILDFEQAYEEDEDETKIVKRKKMDAKPMSEEEAILEMNLLKHDFFIFKDSDTFEIKVLYKRKDGDYGIIETM